MRDVVEKRALFTRTWWVVALCVLSAVQMPAFAQPVVPAPTASPAEGNPVAAAAEASVEPMQELTVVGTRASLQSAISRKKKSDTVVDSIVAEDIAAFPDKNVAEALQRVTGVQLIRDMDEGTQVSIRGVEPDLNRIEIDGLSSLGGSERSGDLREIASDLIKSIDVFKGYSASMTEGGVGGTVSIETRRPLELREPLFALTASGQYLDSDARWTPRVNLTTGSKLFDNRFGFLLNVTRDKVNTRGDYMRNTDWLALADWDKSPEKTVVNQRYQSYNTVAECDAAPAYDDVARSAAVRECQRQWNEYTPSSPRYGIWIREDERTSAQLTLDFQVTDELEVYLRGLWNQRDNRVVDNNYSINLGSASNIQLDSVLLDENRNVYRLLTSTATSGGSSNILGTNNRDFQQAFDTQYYTLGYEWTPADDVKLKGFVATSKNQIDTASNSIALSASVPGILVELDPRNGVPSFRFPVGYDPANPDIYLNQGGLGPVLQFRPSTTQAREDQAKWDLDWNVDRGPLTTFKMGTQYRSARSTSYGSGGYTLGDGTVIPGNNQDILTTVGASDADLNSSAPTWTSQRYASFVEQVLVNTPGTFFDRSTHLDRTYIPQNWLTPQFNRDIIGQFYNLDSFDFDNLYEAVGSDGNVYSQVPAQQVSETIGAAYIQQDFSTRFFDHRLTGNVGVRYATTRVTARSLLTLTELFDNPQGGEVAIERVSQGAVDVYQRYKSVLPALNLNLELARDFNLRIGASKAMARPKISDIARTVTCTYDMTGPVSGGNDSDPEELDTCTAGNPGLKPYMAYQYDVNLLWNPNRDTSLSGGVFLKDIKTYTAGRAYVPTDFFGSGTTISVLMPVNGEGAITYGFELSAQTAFTFLPSPFNGFGGVANYTFSDAAKVGLTNSITGEKLPFLQMSRHTYNLQLYYDRGPFNVRLAYNARSKYMSTAVARSGFPKFTNAQGYLDGKLTLRVPNSGLSFFLEGKNLTKETTLIEDGYDGGVRSTDFAYSGSRYYAGFTYKY